MSSSLFHELKWLTPFHLAIAKFAIFNRPHDEASILACLIKSAPIFALAAFVFVRGVIVPSRRASAKYVFAGLLFSAIGDILLQLAISGYFIHGVVAFALSQSLYTYSFGFRPINLPLGIPIYICGSFFYAYLYPSVVNEPIFSKALIVYSFLICTMFWRAVTRFQFSRAKTSTAFSQLLKGRSAWHLVGCLGATSFVVSDSTLVVWMFVNKFPFSQLIVMGTYYLAQLGISLSVLHDEHEIVDGRPEQSWPVKTR